VIGLGKAEGAFRAHWAAKTQGYEQIFLDVSATVLSHVPNAYGVALVEDGSHKLGHITLLKGAEFHAREPELLKRARSWMPALPIPEVDVLIVDEIGKNISGAGMDTNIIGRGVDLKPMANRRADVRVIYARSLTPESHGNAIGIGLADVVSQRLVDQMDPVFTYTNAISAMTPAPCRPRCASARPIRSPRASRGSATRWRSIGSSCRKRVLRRCRAASRSWCLPATGSSTKPATSTRRPTCCNRCPPERRPPVGLRVRT
jgi:hypothetical protein